MKISTKGKYGLEALTDMAIYSSDGHVSLKSISKRQGISENYLEQIFSVLRKKGILESIRGAQGGYRFSRDLNEITVKQVLNVLEGPLAPVDCAVRDEKPACDHYETCATRVLWEKIADELEAVAASVTIADLVEKYKDSYGSTGLIEYFI
ncbi:MAG: Rrf2 family transcriptional regulator [Clostridiales bacterium]|nr:Rrf2 family transcriptional regulator [Eubacteriales bacterium]MDH7566728.1 Rrf2 family transcriptional regulator [Clostridiales bacterium]